MGGTSVRDPWMRAAALRVLPVRLIASRAKRPVSGLRFRPAQTSGVPTPTWAPAFPDRPRAHELPIRTAMTLGAAGNEMDDYPIDEEKVMAGKDDRIAPAVTAAVEMDSTPSSPRRRRRSRSSCSPAAGTSPNSSWSSS